MVKVIKEKFVVIGKEGSTSDGDGFIQKLWDDADSHFSEIAHLAKRDAKGSIVGIWGAMSDSPVHLNRGRTASVKACIWREWSVTIMQKHLMAGRNG